MRNIACVLAALALSPALVAAKEGTRNLGPGLEQAAATQGGGQSVRRLASPASDLQFVNPVQFDQSGRALVRITLDGKVPFASVLQTLRGTAGVEIAASDANYRAGVIEAYVPTAALAGVARSKGVRAVVPSSPMGTNAGAARSQGIVQHRIDKIAGVDGAGITVGVMSNSYDLSPGEQDSAALDIASGDLPGPGNPLGNTQPVIVLEDFPNVGDEGRALMQIVHDLAPRARLAFATAATGEVGFADNIRALAGIAGATHARPGFKADIIVDDVFYTSEPFFQDGIIAQAVDDAAAAGVSYFASAGNAPASQAYDSKVRIVPAAATADSGLDFSTVPPALYAGGFHDFAPGAAVDISQTLQADNGLLTFQWNEPFDPLPPTPIGPPLAAGVGTVPRDGAAQFTFDGSAGRLVEIFTDADSSTTGTAIPDLVFTLLDPSGQVLRFVDTGSNPESTILELPADGTYTVMVDSFFAFQFGDFLYRVQQVEVAEQVLSDYNLLFFSNGSFVFASQEQNLFTNRPLEQIGLPSATLELVIARANTPPRGNRNVANHIRYVGFFGGINPQEHFDYLAPIAAGHSTAQGAISVTAYPFAPPFVPVAATSPGPATIYFDKNNRRLRQPQVRQKPDVAAVEGVNNTFFGVDSDADDDTLPNFFGTSAAAPHAAAIAALVLDAAGGRGKVKPSKMRRILQDSAFQHDLDPFFASGSAFSSRAGLSINASADSSATAQLDPNVFTVMHLGGRSVRSLSIDASAGNPTQTPKGIVFDERDVLGQPFVVGRSVGLTAGNVVATFSLPANPPAEPGQWKQLDLKFTPGTFGSGDLLSFGVDRDEADAAGPLIPASGGNSADLLGGGVSIPSGQVVPGGVRFFGTLDGGGTFDGQFFNLVGRGYTPVDGYGFINAEAAVRAVRKRKR